MGQSRFPEMDLVIDDARQQVFAPCINLFSKILFHTWFSGFYCTDDPSPDQHKTVHDIPIVDNICVFNQVVVHS